jgi:hypothetical protein
MESGPDVPVTVITPLVSTAADISTRRSTGSTSGAPRRAAVARRVREMADRALSILLCMNMWAVPGRGRWAAA